ncbi:MAG: GTP-binding protein, partial [Muribaculaceae bacterium]|nr:GTP-binding protein [Muribaculaceae bacterium]
MKHNDTPVLLLTGYLGSGKTTLLNRILTNERGIRFAVIVNDIGEVNIDASLIQKGGVVGKKDEGDLVALQNGCICCTLKMDLVEQLAEIMDIGKFDYIVIEASGICEPAPIAQTICSIPSMGRKYTENGVPRLDCIATVVDALRMASEFGCGDRLKRDSITEDDIENLVIEQIEFCNIILLNKISEVTPEEAGRIRAIIRALQPKAKIIECDYCDIDLNLLLNTHTFDFNQVSGSAAWIEAVESDYHEEDEHE